MHARKPYVLALAFLFITGAVAWSQTTATFDSGFKAHAMTQVRQLARFGIREAGSTQESKAAGYVAEQFKEAGLSVTKEPFRFQTFTLQQAFLEAGRHKAEIVKLSFDPYSIRSPLKGDLVLVASTVPRAVIQMDLDGKIVVVADDNSFKIVSIYKKPKAVVRLSAADFERLKESHADSAAIRFRGKSGTAASANIVGTLPAGLEAPEIILAAHYDSARGPGANDNASGVAVMLELVRYFVHSEFRNKFSFRFVAFGAEEAGLLGSKAYLERHMADLQKCRLLVNIDQIGGDGAVHIDAAEGGNSVPTGIANQLPRELMDKAVTDSRDPQQKWILLSAGDRALWTSSNCPEWLRSAVSKASAGMDHKVIERSHTGSDHRVFIQAGIVAIHIGSDGGAEVHAPTDVPEAVNADNMELAARFVVSLLQQMPAPTVN